MEMWESVKELFKDMKRQLFDTGNTIADSVNIIKERESYPYCFTVCFFSKEEK